MNDDIAARIASLPDAQLTLTGWTFDDITVAPDPESVPFHYLAPSRRGWLHWEAVQFTGTVNPTGDDGEFRVTGPLTCTVHRRFWTRWGCQRYLRRHRTGRTT